MKELTRFDQVILGKTFAREGGTREALIAKLNAEGITKGRKIILEAYDRTIAWDAA